MTRGPWGKTFSLRHAHGNVAAIVALLLVVPAIGLRGVDASSFDVGVGHVAEDHAAFEAGEIPWRVPQAYFAGFGVFEHSPAGGGANGA